MMEVFPTPDDPSIRTLKLLVSLKLGLMVLDFPKVQKLLKDPDLLICPETGCDEKK